MFLFSFFQRRAACSNSLEGVCVRVWERWKMQKGEKDKEQGVKILHDPAAMCRFNDVVVVSLTGLISNL